MALSVTQITVHYRNSLFPTVQRVTGEIGVWESSEGSSSNTGVSLACGRAAPFLSEGVEAELFVCQCTPTLLCPWEMAPSHTGHWGLIWDSHNLFVAREWFGCVSAVLQGLTKLNFPDCFPSYDPP